MELISISSVSAWCRSLECSRHDFKGGLTVRPPFAYMTGRGGMAEEARKQIREIEQTQQALRESIEQAKELADKAQELLQKHKNTVDRSPSD